MNTISEGKERRKEEHEGDLSHFIALEELKKRKRKKAQIVVDQKGKKTMKETVKAEEILYTSLCS